MNKSKIVKEVLMEAIEEREISIRRLKRNIIEQASQIACWNKVRKRLTKEIKDLRQ